RALLLPACKVPPQPLRTTFPGVRLQAPRLCELAALFFCGKYDLTMRGDDSRMQWSAGGARGNPTALPEPRGFADAAAQIVGITLENGLQVLIWPDHRIPNVALYTWVRVGSRNEGNGPTGLAHFFEHMMFNG